MKKMLANYTDYKAYLNDWMASQPKGGWGLKSKLAEALNCQVAYISQVLSGTNHISLEQVEDINDFVGHSDTEAQFFRLLVQENKAGSVKLRQRLGEEIKKKKSELLGLEKRVSFANKIDDQHLLQFYGSWQNIAIQQALETKGCTNEQDLTKRFRLPPAKIQESLRFLKNAGIITEHQGRLKSTQSQIILDSKSPAIFSHHRNWRMKAAESLDWKQTGIDYHFTAVASLSKEDIDKIREIYLQASQRAMDTSAQSKDPSEVCALVMDFFRVY